MTDSGRVPEMEVTPRSQLTIRLREPYSGGMVPEMNVPPRKTYSSAASESHARGRVPEMELWSSWRFSSLASPPISSGSTPASLLKGSSIFVMKPSASQVMPCHLQQLTWVVIQPVLFCHEAPRVFSKSVCSASHWPRAGTMGAGVGSGVGSGVGTGVGTGVGFGAATASGGAAGAAAGGSTEVPTAFAVAVPETAVAEVVRAAYVDPSDPTKLYVEAAGPRARRGGHFRE
mmetsp:Transcript_11992/g.39524  ORF Transcript_11992/g.39524 Transcript_11992/m.39524 type:complete len:231 (+) Transcript_11992:429-1121(+)